MGTTLIGKLILFNLFNYKGEDCQSNPKLWLDNFKAYNEWLQKLSGSINENSGLLEQAFGMF
jgi:hypothetical protein